MIRKLLASDWPEDVLMYVNFPDVVHGSVNGVNVVRQGRRNLFDLNIEHRIDAHFDRVADIAATAGRRERVPPEPAQRVAELET